MKPLVFRTDYQINSIQNMKKIFKNYEQVKKSRTFLKLKKSCRPLFSMIYRIFTFINCQLLVAFIKEHLMPDNRLMNLMNTDYLRP